jgi:hypothetical protein
MTGASYCRNACGFAVGTSVTSRYSDEAMSSSLRKALSGGKSWTTACSARSRILSESVARLRFA